jgi:hypothetical protein
VLMLYDAPLYRDWAFWLTASLAVFTAWAIGTSPSTSSLPLWLDTALAVLIFTALFGVIPAVIRLQIRKWRWRRHRARRAAVGSEAPHSPLERTQAPLPADGVSAVESHHPTAQDTAPSHEKTPPLKEPSMPSGYGREVKSEPVANVFPVPSGNSHTDSVGPYHERGPYCLTQQPVRLAHSAWRRIRRTSTRASSTLVRR